MTQQRIPRALRIVLITTITVAVLALLAWRVDLYEVGRAMTGFHLTWLIAAAAVALVFNTVQSAEALRWMLRGYSIRIGYGASLAATTGNMAIKAALPASTGELTRVLWLQRAHGVSAARSTAAIVTLLWFKLLWLLVVATVGAWLHPGVPAVQRVLLTVVALVAVVATFAAPALLATVPGGEEPEGGPGRVTHRVGRAMDSRRAGPLALGGLHALVAVAAEMAVFAMILLGSGATVDPARLAAGLPLVIIGAKVPLTLMGLGTREALAVLFLAGPVAPAVILSASLVFSVLEYVLPAALGAAFTWHYVRRILTPAS